MHGEEDNENNSEEGSLSTYTTDFKIATTK
jgi:hypothetical protein